MLLPPVFLMVRFIPAYAGNSRALFFAIFFSPVHPRLRGELPVYSVPGLMDHGSSPLTRGTHCTETIQPGKGRFIPAYAGNSGHSVQGTSICPVHPRLRGELFNIRRLESRSVGSSPLTRGTLNCDFLYFPLNRFIPAYAGNSSLVMKSFLAIPVHPRLRGELI